MTTKTFLAFAALFSLAALLAGPAMATPINVYNYSMQSEVVADGSLSGSGAGTLGWYAQNGTGIYAYNPTSADFVGAGGNGALPSPAVGSQCLYNASTVDTDVAVLTTYRGATKTVARLDAGMEYTYTVAIGQALTLHGAPWYGGFSFIVADQSSGNQFASWEFHTGPSIGNSVHVDKETPDPGTFLDYTVTFDCDKYIGQNGHAAGDYLLFGIVLGMQAMADNVRLDEHVAPVPEPSTLALMASGLIGLAAYAWRKQK